MKWLYFPSAFALAAVLLLVIAGKAEAARGCETTVDQVLAFPDGRVAFMGDNFRQANSYAITVCKAQSGEHCSGVLAQLQAALLSKKRVNVRLNADDNNSCTAMPSEVDIVYVNLIN